MIEIRRTFDPTLGLQGVEQLNGYVFSPESFAHTFFVEPTGGADFGIGQAFGFFLRADGRRIVINGMETAGVDPNGCAYVKLTPECYAVPGRFLLLILYAEGSSETVIYAAESTVLSADGAETQIAAASALTIQEQLRRIMVSANNVALFARNIGEIEGQLETVQTTYNGIDEALANAGVWAMRKNLLDKDAWWVNTPENGNIIYGNASQYSGPGAYMQSISNNRTVTFDTEPTSEQTAGAYRIYHRTAGQDSSGNTRTEAWIVSWVVDDGIGTSCVSLTGDNIITDQDGEVYNKAIEYSITENSAWGNMETLYYPAGAWNLYRKEGDAFKSHGYLVDAMEVGEVYTVSCWARITSGSEAWVKFGWGGTGRNSMGSPSDKAGASDVIKVTGSEWHRIAWTFTFNPAGAEYTETTEAVTDSGGNTYNRIKRSFNWCKRVMIGVHRKYTATLQLCGFRLSKGGLYGSDTVDTLKEQIKNLTARVAALESNS